MSTLRDRDGSHEFCNTPIIALPVLGAGHFCTARLQDIVTIGGRAGWAAGRWMPYVTGGYANAGMDFDNRIPAPGAAGATVLVEQAHTRLGRWYVGGGVESTSAVGTPRRARVVRMLLLAARLLRACQWAPPLSPCISPTRRTPSQRA